MSGWFFWVLVSYSLVGLVSGVALGPEWLRLANPGGVHNATMLAPGVVFLGVAVIFRLAILKRAAADAISRFFSLLGWAALFGAAAQSGVGWLGRWPDADGLWIIHAVVQLFALPLVALAFLATLRVATASNLMIFKIPGALLAAGAGAVVLHSAIEIILGIAVAEIWVVTFVLLSVAALRVATITPHKNKEQSWRRSESTKTLS